MSKVYVNDGYMMLLDAIYFNCTLITQHYYKLNFLST